jgi:predicted RNA-binding protein with PUA-like domain
MAKYWLMKTEPSAYSIEDLRRDGRTCWDGVRNYQARNFMRDDMREGDEVLFYHSGAKPPGVAGVAKVVRAGYPDHTARDPEDAHFDPKASDEDPRWYMVDIEFVRAFPEVIPLAELRDTKGLGAMPLTNKSRLSVQPVTEAEFGIIHALGEAQSG